MTKRPSIRIETEGRAFCLDARSSFDRSQGQTLDYIFLKRQKDHYGRDQHDYLPLNSYLVRAKDVSVEMIRQPKIDSVTMMTLFTK